MPFLSVVLVTCIVLSIGVMAFYFVLVAWPYWAGGALPERDGGWEPQPEPASAPTGRFEPLIGRRPVEVPPVEGRSAIIPRADLPVYDMENFPTDKWEAS